MMLVEIILHLGRTCDNSRWVGDVVRAVCGQKVKLDRGQRHLVAICNEGLVKADERRERDRVRKAESRAKKKSGCK